MSDLDSNDIKGINMVHSSVKLPSDFTGEQLFNAILPKATTSWSSWEVSYIYVYSELNINTFYY